MNECNITFINYIINKIPLFGPLCVSVPHRILLFYNQATRPAFFLLFCKNFAVRPAAFSHCQINDDTASGFVVI